MTVLKHVEILRPTVLVAMRTSVPIDTGFWNPNNAKVYQIKTTSELVQIEMRPQGKHQLSIKKNNAKSVHAVKSSEVTKKQHSIELITSFFFEVG